MFSNDQNTESEIDINSAFLSFFDNRTITGEDYQCFKEPSDTEILKMNLMAFEKKMMGCDYPLDNQSNNQTNLPPLSDEILTNSQIVLFSKKAIKRGRRTKGLANDSTAKEPIHTKESIDNIRRKIKTHFVQFIISFMNEVIAAKYQSKPKLELKPIDYKVIKNITQSMNYKLFQMKLKDFLNLPLSTRVKFNRNQNVYIITNIANSSIDCLTDLLEMTLTDFYERIYLGKAKDIKCKYGLNESRTKKQFEKNQLHFFEEDLDSLDKKEERYYYLTQEIGMTLTHFFNNKTVKPPVER